MLHQARLSGSNSVVQEANILPRNLKGNLQSFPLLDRHFIPKLLRAEDVVVGRLEMVVVVDVVALLVVVKVVVDVVEVEVVMLGVVITWLL